MNFQNHLTVYLIDSSPGMAEKPAEISDSYFQLARRYVMDQLLNRVIWNRKTEKAAVFLDCIKVLDFGVPTGSSVCDADYILKERKSSLCETDILESIGNAVTAISSFSGKSRLAKNLIVISPQTSSETVQTALQICRPGDINLQWAAVGPVDEALLDEFPENVGLFSDASDSIGSTKKRKMMARKLAGGDCSMCFGEDKGQLWDIAVELFPATRAAPADSLHTKGLDSDENPVDVKRITQYLLEPGKPVDEKDARITAGYLYGSEIINADRIDLKHDFEDVEPTQRSSMTLDVLAIVDKVVEPWIPLGYSNYVIAPPFKPRSALWISAFSQVLNQEKKSAIVRFRKRLGDPEIHLLESSMLAGKPECLLATRLPFSEEYASSYSFAPLKPDPEPIDESMDRIVDDMVVDVFESDEDDADQLPELKMGNPFSTRLAQLVKSRILPDDFQQIVKYEPFMDKLQVNAEALDDVVGRFNIHEKTPQRREDDAVYDTEPIMELDIDELLARGGSN